MIVGRHQLTSPRNLRLGALVLVLVTIHQIDDPLLDATLGEEVFYWIVRTSVLALGLWIADIVVSKTLNQRWASPEWLKPVVVVTALGMLPLALTEILVEPYLPMRPEFVDDDLWDFSPVLAFFSEYITLLTIVIPIHLLLWLLIDRNTPKESVTVDVPTEPVPEFLKRTSIQQTSAILALQAEEHYVRVYAKDTEELIHYRFGDAVQEMPTALGLQVHRSWWVADAGVASAKRGTRRWQLKLINEVAVPVSDSYVKAVREAGWLKRKKRT